MKRLLMTTTALIALGGVTSALADLGISGNARWTYTTWSDKAVDDADSGNNNTAMGEGLEIWFKANETSDTGLSYGAGVRMRSGKKGIDRNYVHVSDDWGKLTFGRQWSPLIAGSLGANWRGTIKGAQQSKVGSGGLRKTSWITTSGNSPKVIYNSPNFSGVTVGVSFTDAGADTKADSTSWRVNYKTELSMDSSLTLGYGSEKQKAADGADASKDTTNTEMGVEFTSGDFLVSAVQMKDKSDTNNGVNTKDQTTNEIEIAYDVSDVLTLNYITLKSKEDATGVSNGDKYSSDAVGLKYEIAPGLLANVIHTKADYEPSATNTADADSGNTTYVEIRVNF